MLRWTAEHDDCRNTEITRDAQEWQVSRRVCDVRRVLRLPCRLLVRVINQIPGEVAGVRGGRAEWTAVVRM